MNTAMQTTHPSAALPGTLEHWADVQPDAVALIEGERQLCWKAWNDQADRLAQALHVYGLQSGDIVVLRLQTRLEWPVIAAALAKLGCWLLGLNWRLTNTEIRYVLNNSRASAIVCDDNDPAALLPAFADQGLKLAVSLDAPASGFVTLAELLAATPSAPPLYATGEPPLIIYTSGTTGLPKGVVLDRRLSDSDPITIEYLLDVRAKRQIGVDDRTAYLVSMPLHHGSGPGQLWAAQRSGVLTVLQRRFDAQEALALIARHRLTHWVGVPTMYKRIAALPKQVIAQYDLCCIRQLTIGAAPASAELKAWIMAHLGDCLHEGYGSTETGMLTHMPPHMQRIKPSSCGLPYRHVTLEIRDANGQTLPAGHTGEIWAKSPVNIRSYLNAPPLEADTLDARGFFRTGDMGHLDADGYLTISDRAKDMIISGGVNISPAEIEAALLTHPALADAAVIGIPDDEMGERIMAFCQRKPGCVVTEAALLAHCVDGLAAHKRPREIRIVDALPHNTVGKVLKRDLRAPFWKNHNRQV